MNDMCGISILSFQGFPCKWSEDENTFYKKNTETINVAKTG